MTIVIGIIAGLISAFATHRAVTALLPRFPLRRSNYRGVFVTTSMGMGIVLGIITATGAIALASTISPSHFPIGAWLAPLAALGGFAALGLFDDLTSTLDGSSERGFSGHMRALARGKLTSGGIKMLAGAALAFAIAVPLTNAKGFIYALLGGIIIALFANVSNCFDLRPGRSSKVFLVAAIPLAALSGPERAVMLAGIGAIVAFLPFDLRERAMLGDAGSNAIGAFLGTCIVASSSRGVLLLVAAILALVQVAAETITLSSVIESIPFMRAIDLWGRVSEPIDLKFESKRI
ncbi:MAG: hypothetical protein ACYDCC_04515 [Actinomycetota bacterium]